jgi:rRNA maturation RNase YbeY
MTGEGKDEKGDPVGPGGGMAPRVELRNRQRKYRINTRKLAARAEAILNCAGREKEALSLLFVNDRGMRKINRTFRGLDAPTDVLSFPRGGIPNRFRPILGDIVISVESAVRQAAELGHSRERELVFLLIHGILHLLGWDHERSPEEARRMYRKQRELMAAIREDAGGSGGEYGTF